ncbi:MAG: hypothetical protein K2K10_05225 [Acetatifactor sp.]|nr:hypothetical protein [Acetatifactor sp.]
MKKKSIMLLMVTVLAMSLTACKPQMLKEAMNTEDKTSEESSGEDVSGGNVSDGTEQSSEGQKKLPGMMFGSEFNENELDLEYLYAEVLRTESKENPQTGKMESKQLQILLPQGDYNTVNRDYAYGEKLGVRVRVELNPYLRSHHEDYTLKENLDYVLNQDFDAFYQSDYRDVQISEIEGDEEQVTAEVLYLDYDKYDDEYVPYQMTYQLCDFGDDMMALVKITICAENTTGKTPAILEEINAFYGSDIQWDADAAEARKQKFLAGNNTDVLQVSTGWLMFDLPKTWAQDWKNNDDYTMSLYAPDGDMRKSGCYISVGREWQTYGSEIDIASIAGSESDMAILKAAIAQAADLKEEDVTVSDYGMTVLGQALEFSYVITEEGISYEEHRWWISDKNYIYQITAGQIDGSKEDAIAIAKEILEKGQVKGADL